MNLIQVLDESCSMEHSDEEHEILREL